MEMSDRWVHDLCVDESGIGIGIRTQRDKQDGEVICVLE